MKSLIFILMMLSLTITSCSSSTKELKASEPVFNSTEGYVQMSKFSVDSLKFINSIKELKDESDIQSLIYMTCLFAEDNCEHELTFKPHDAFISKGKGDTIEVLLTFEAQNAYGVPGKLSALVPYLNDTPILENAFVVEN